MDKHKNNASEITEIVSKALVKIHYNQLIESESKLVNESKKQDFWSNSEKAQKTMQEIADLIHKFPELKDVIVNALLGELIKSNNYSKQDIETIRELYKEHKLKQNQIWLKLKYG